MFILLLLFLLAAVALCVCRTLLRTVVLSRHGIRSPLPPPPRLESSDSSDFEHIQDYSKTRRFPVRAEQWGFDSQEAFDKQYLTPHGSLVQRYMGAYFYERYAKTKGVSCDKLAQSLFVAADNSTRDIQTASAFLDGFLQPAECAAVKKDIQVHVSPKISRIFNCDQVYPDMGAKCRVSAGRKRKKRR